MVFNVLFSLVFQALHVYGVFLRPLSGPFEPPNPPPVFSGPPNLVCRLIMVASLVFMMGTSFLPVQTLMIRPWNTENHGLGKKSSSLSMHQ
jgi:hypothetical protein